MSHVSSSVRYKESCLFLSADVCLRSSFRPEDGCRLLSEPTVLECLEVVLCGAMRSRMRLHKFLFSCRGQLGCCPSCDTQWQIKKKPRGCRWVACSHLLCVCASSHVPWSWHRDARKVTAAGGVRLVCSETGVSLSGSFIIMIFFYSCLF